MRDVRRFRLAGGLCVVLLLAAFSLRHDVTGLAFVVRAADMHGAVRTIADVDTNRFTERLLQLPSARGPIRGRLYMPSGASHRVALLTSGLHPAGIDEPRLVGLARQLASTGVAVVTPDIPELSRFEITPAITDDIERAAAWLSHDSGMSEDGRVALMGISFSGGLSVVAAGRPSIRDNIAYVFSFGGHDDLPRVLRYLCTGEVAPEPRALNTKTESTDGGTSWSYRRPHDYGVAVILLAIADRLVPADQVAPLRDAVRRFLWASHLERVDTRAAESEFAALRTVASKLDEPSATLLQYVNNRDVARLGPRLLPYIDEYGRAPALSPSRSPAPSAPVFLLHGIDDNVIPAIESEYLAEDLRPHTPVRLLLNALISHAEADQPVHVRDVATLADFWGDVLSR